MPALKQWEEIGQNYLKVWEPIALKNNNIKEAMEKFNKETQQLINK